jgi:PKD repeat protein
MGLADVGGQYTSDGPSSSFNVGGGRGNIVLSSTGNTRGVRLDGVHVRDVDMRVRVTTDKVATGNGQLYAYLVTRANGASAYRPKIIIFPNGSVNVHSGVMVNGNESSMGTSVTVPGLTYTAGRWIWIRAQVTGVNPTTVRVKRGRWLARAANWQFTATNSAPALQVAGGVGMHTYMSSTSAPTTFSFDDFTRSSRRAAPPPAANFSSSQQSGTLAVDFTDTSTGSPTAWSWTFGDNTTSTLQNPTHTFATAGPYSVTLTASNRWPNSITKTVTVNPAPPPPPPTADFTWAQQSGTLNVNFTDASTGAPTAWTWNFGDGGTSTAQSPAMATPRRAPTASH